MIPLSPFRGRALGAGGASCVKAVSETLKTGWWRAVNSNSVGTFLSALSHSNPEGTSGQKAESLPKPRHRQSPLRKIETERISPDRPASSPIDLSLRDFELRRRRARRLFATLSPIFSASETRPRRGWDSNPRGTFIPAGFQDRCLQPLGHPSLLGSQFRDFRRRLVARWIP